MDVDFETDAVAMRCYVFYCSVRLPKVTSLNVLPVRCTFPLPLYLGQLDDMFSLYSINNNNLKICTHERVLFKRPPKIYINNTVLWVLTLGIYINFNVVTQQTSFKPRTLVYRDLFYKIIDDFNVQICMQTYLSY